MTEPHLLDPLRWQTLTTLLAELASARPELAPQCEAIRAPVETLQRLWRDALASLQGDRSAGERIGALVVAAGPVAALVRAAALAQDSAHAAKLAIDHRPGLVRIGELAVTAIAAARMAPRTTKDEPSGSTTMYVNVVHGLALQAAPAELLARLDPHGAPVDLLADLVARLLPRALVNGFAERIQLRRFIYDPVELGRWACLAEAFAALGYGPGGRPDQPVPVDLRGWSPARADGIESVRRAGGVVTMRGRFPWASHVSLADVAILGAGPDDHTGTKVARGRLTKASPTQLTAELDPSAEWVGFARAADREEARAVRAEVRHQLDAIGRLACVANPSLSAAIVDPSDLAVLAEAPPHGAANVLSDPERVTAWLAPTRIEAGSSVTLSWSTTAAAVEIVDPHGVSINVGPTGSRSFVLDEVGPAEFALYGLQPAVATHVTAAPPPRRGPERRVRVEVVEAVPSTAADDANEGAELTFVVFRPWVLSEERCVEPEAAHQALKRASRRLGASAKVVDLPWVEDALAVMETLPSDAGDPRVPYLLEHLERAAARTPGLEQAVWIALVPERGKAEASIGDGWSPLGAGQPGEAALAVAVASPTGVIAALTDIFRKVSEPPHATREALAVDRATRPIEVLHAAARRPASRLRLVGVLTGDAIRLIDAPRLDLARGAGPGAPAKAGLTAVCLDQSGREVARGAVGTHRRGDDVGFTALVAITEDVAAIELRVMSQTALRVVRPGGSPQLAKITQARLEPHAQFAFSWQLASGSASAVVIEVAATEGFWVPIAELCGCSQRDLVPLWRLGPGAYSARIVATDGWNVATVEIAADDAWHGARRGPFVLRRVGDGKLWADIPASATPHWTTKPAGLPEPSAGSRLLAVPPRTIGEVAFQVAGIIERVALGEADGYRRP